MTPEFLLTTLIVVVSPGTGVLYTPAAGLARGARECGTPMRVSVSS
jgi:threonine/homoserine/homoserine lactone efflux protein